MNRIIYKIIRQVINSENWGIISNFNFLVLDLDECTWSSRYHIHCQDKKTPESFTKWQGYNKKKWC